MSTESPGTESLRREWQRCARTFGPGSPTTAYAFRNYRESVAFDDEHAEAPTPPVASSPVGGEQHG